MNRPHDISIEHNGLHVLLRFDAKNRPMLVHLGSFPPPPDLPTDPPSSCHLVQLQGDQPEKGWIYQAARGLRHGAALPGMDLAYCRHHWLDLPAGGAVWNCTRAPGVWRWLPGCVFPPMLL